MATEGLDRLGTAWNSLDTAVENTERIPDACSMRLQIDRYDGVAKTSLATHVVRGFATHLVDSQIFTQTARDALPGMAELGPPEEWGSEVRDVLPWTTADDIFGVYYVPGKPGESPTLIVYSTIEKAKPDEAAAVHGTILRTAQEQFFSAMAARTMKKLEQGDYAPGTEFLAKKAEQAGVEYNTSGVVDYETLRGSMVELYQKIRQAKATSSRLITTTPDQIPQQETPEMPPPDIEPSELPPTEQAPPSTSIILPPGVTAPKR